MAEQTRTTRTVIRLLDVAGNDILEKPYIAESYADAAKAYNQALLDAYEKQLEEYSVKSEFCHIVIS